MSASVQNRRKRYFIDKGFQSKYVAMLVLFIVAVGIAGILILVLGSGETATDQQQNDLNDAILAMVALIVIFVVFIAWYGVRFSHRVVGPVYAFNRHLNWIRDGNYTRDLRLRAKDEFQTLATVLNNTQATLRQRVRDDIDVMNKIDGGLGELADVLSAADANPEQTKELIARLRRDLEAARVKNEGYINP